MFCVFYHFPGVNGSGAGLLFWFLMAGILKKKPCKYGSKCYRRNPQHLEEYSHPEQKVIQGRQSLKVDVNGI